jgi:hypothetical protein
MNRRNGMFEQLWAGIGKCRDALGRLAGRSGAADPAPTRCAWSRERTSLGLAPSYQGEGARQESR